MSSATVCVCANEEEEKKRDLKNWKWNGDTKYNRYWRAQIITIDTILFNKRNIAFFWPFAGILETLAIYFTVTVFYVASINFMVPTLSTSCAAAFISRGFPRTKPVCYNHHTCIHQHCGNLIHGVTVC